MLKRAIEILGPEESFFFSSRLALAPDPLRETVTPVPVGRRDALRPSSRIAVALHGVDEGAVLCGHVLESFLRQASAIRPGLDPAPGCFAAVRRSPPPDFARRRSSSSTRYCSRRSARYFRISKSRWGEVRFSSAPVSGLQSFENRS